MTITAAILIIGNEILSGRTKDANGPWLAERLGTRGIILSEIRVVRDVEENIVSAVRALCDKYTYVFTTGGIGPTHDDITADCMATAFGIPLEIHPKAKQAMMERCTMRGIEMNEGHLRMSRIPKGAELIANEVSAAPGFIIRNVYVMAGVPPIMQSMFLSIEDTLQKSAVILSRSINTPLRESDLSKGLKNIQDDFHDVEIGSYPHADGVEIVLRGTNESSLESAAQNVTEMVTTIQEQQQAS